MITTINKHIYDLENQLESRLGLDIIEDKTTLVSFYAKDSDITDNILTTKRVKQFLIGVFLIDNNGKVDKEPIAIKVGTYKLSTLMNIIPTGENSAYEDGSIYDILKEQIEYVTNLRATNVANGEYQLNKNLEYFYNLVKSDFN